MEILHFRATTPFAATHRGSSFIDESRPTIALGGVRYALVDHGADGVGSVGAFVRADQVAPQARPQPISVPATGPDATVLATIARDGVAAQMSAVADAFGMPAAVERSLVALYRTCDVRVAAQQQGIAYETIRKNLESARIAMGAPTMARLLSLAIAGAGSGLESGAGTDRVFKQIFDLTERQMRLACLFADGSTRPGAARILGISDAVAKVELSTLFAATGVSSGLELARLMAETRLIVSLTTNAVFDEPHPPPASASFTLTAPDGRRIAGSDYGPQSGAPVFVLHVSINSRPVNRALVEALQDAGFRPISLDRPGYGDSCAVAATVDRTYFEIAADDMALACEQLGLETVDLVSRGAAQVVLAFQLRHPARLRRAAVLNPDPDTKSSTSSKGLVAPVKLNFARRPWAVAAMARVMMKQASYERVASSLLQMSADCPADLAAMRETANVMDFFRGIEAAHRGRIDGYVSEQVALATVPRPQPVPGTTGIALLIGARDFIHDPGQTVAYWRDVLPDARLTIVEDGGRFLSYTHAELAVRHLLDR